MKFNRFVSALTLARKAWIRRRTILLIGLASLWITLPAHAGVFFNTAPTANPGGPYTIRWGESLVVNGSASFDPDTALGSGYEIQVYEWDLFSDGSIDAHGMIHTFDFDDLMIAGFHGLDVYSLRLRVTDSSGGVGIRETMFAIVPAEAIAAVPEPETLALVLAGLGLISGFSLRRKT